jgi:uncharacterized protein (UPF0335 family)
MNTIQITNDEGQTVNYTEEEVKNVLRLRKQHQELADSANTELRKIRNEVRDFFSEGEWDTGEQTVNKGDVNFLLERIGCNKLTTVYRGAATISFDFEVEAEDEDDARTIIEEYANVSSHGFDYSNESVVVDEIDENY